MNSFYVISRGMKPGKALTIAQRTSSHFAEEPVVMGKVLRANAQPIKISDALFAKNQTHLLTLKKAGAIEITRLFEQGAIGKEDAQNLLQTPPETLSLDPEPVPQNVQNPPEPAVEQVVVVAQVEEVQVQEVEIAAKTPEPIPELPVEVKASKKGKGPK